MSAVLLLAAAAFPPLAALRWRAWALFWAMCAVETVILLVFFLAAAGPAALAHASLWLFGVVFALRRRPAQAQEAWLRARAGRRLQEVSTE